MHHAIVVAVVVVGDATNATNAKICVLQDLNHAFLVRAALTIPVLPLSNVLELLGSARLTQRIAITQTPAAAMSIMTTRNVVGVLVVTLMVS